MMGCIWFNTVKSVVNVGAMGAIATTMVFESIMNTLTLQLKVNRGQISKQLHPQC